MYSEGRPSAIPFGVYKRRQTKISLCRLYPLTAFYTIYSAALLFLALRWTAHPIIAVAFYLAGIPVWTLVEYVFHRYVLHQRFPPGKGIIKRLLHKHLDHLHIEHHERPYDGEHISGELKDLLPLFAVAAPASFIFPLYTLPMLLAGVVQSYVTEEWIHHCIHYYNFRNPYFRHIKRYHLYHHSHRGAKMGYGITSGFWDLVFKSRYPDTIRQRLSARKIVRV